MLKRSLVSAVMAGALLAANAFAQAPAPAAPATPPARGGGQQVGGQGDPDPGVHFINIVENPHVRVLQVTLQPGAVRRMHVHNDVTFHMLVPVTGALELTVDGQAINAVQGQAYYMVKGQQHGFTNKTAAPVQVVELFIKPPADAATPAAAAAPATPAAPAAK